MAQDIQIAGATFNAVPSIVVPVAGGGSATFVDPSPTTAAAADVASGKLFFSALGVLTPGTASGGGGGQYAWLGSGAEKVATAINRAINLKNDTGYDSWSASTTATTLIAASTNPDYTLSADFNSYDYCFVTRGFIEPVYVSGTPATYRTHRVAQYYVTMCYGYPSNSAIAQVQADETGNSSNATTSTNLYIQYYYNNAGKLTARSATQCGPLYMSTYPTISSGTLSNGSASVTYKLPAFYAKCDNSRFTTTRKGQVDSANTNYYLTLDIYRVPHGNGIFSHWVSAMCAALNAP